MSAALKVRPTTAPPLRTPLSLVPQRRSRVGRAPFVAVVLALLASGLLGLLTLNTVLAQDAFRLHELRSEGRLLADREQALLTKVEDLQAPRALAERARASSPAGHRAAADVPERFAEGFRGAFASGLGPVRFESDCFAARASSSSMARRIPPESTSTSG